VFSPLGTVSVTIATVALPPSMILVGDSPADAAHQEELAQRLGVSTCPVARHAQLAAEAHRGVARVVPGRQTRPNIRDVYWIQAPSPDSWPTGPPG